MKDDAHDNEIEGSIFIIRGKKVMLDRDLAQLFGTTTSRLNEQVKRNKHRFPDDFMFQLSYQEVRDLMSQFAISSLQHGGRRKHFYAFTEHGAVMLASVLDTKIAVNASVEIVRAFIRMRAIIASHEELSRRLDALEKKYDAQFKVVFNSIRELIETKPKALPEVPSKKRPIGFGRE